MKALAAIALLHCSGKLLCVVALHKLSYAAVLHCCLAIVVLQEMIAFTWNDTSATRTQCAQEDAADPVSSTTGDAAASRRPCSQASAIWIGVEAPIGDRR